MINLIAEADVSAATLAIELERATIGYESRDDGSLYVREGGWFPFWIQVYDASALIALGTYIEFRDSATELDRLKLSNMFNRYAFGICAYALNDRLKIDHILNYRDGLLRENFIRVSRNFSAIISKSIREHDPEQLLLVPLSDGPSGVESRTLNSSND